MNNSTPKEEANLECEICGRQQRSFNVVWDKDKNPHLLCGQCQRGKKVDSTPSEGWEKEIKNYECREYDGIKWIRYDHYLDALSSQLKEVEKYHELIMAVGNKYEGETRHETALRYIKQAEEERAESAELSQLAEGEELEK